MRNELAGFYTFTAQGSLKSIGYMFAGSIELLQPGMDLDRLAEPFNLFVKAIKETVIE
jgi:hypothetical protein